MTPSPSLAASYGLTPEDFTFLAEVQNTVFAFAKNGSDFVLRLTPATHRPFEYVEAEIAWVRHLASRGVRVAAPVTADNGLMAQRIDDDGRSWTAAAFHRAPGRIGAAQDWQAKTFRAWGKTMGQMHRAAESCPAPPPRRPDWSELLPRWEAGSADERAAQEKLGELVANLSILPRTPDQYGLIHADLHFWNFSIDDTGLTAFDFDNCETHWFLADLGTAVFEASTCIHQRMPRQEFIHEFLREFLAGYRSERDPGELLMHLPSFVKLREIQIFLILSERWKNREIGPFQKSFFASLSQAVRDDEPFVTPETMEKLLVFSTP